MRVSFGALRKGFPAWGLSFFILFGWSVSSAAQLDDCQRALVGQLYDFYNSTQLRYNVAWRSSEVHDPVKYSKPIAVWEVSENAPEVTVFGALQGSPLVLSNGMIKIYNHTYKGNPAGLPDPSVTEPSGMQSSTRTFTATPEGQYPHFVKFSDVLYSRPTKMLNAQYLRLATDRSQRFLADPQILPDRAGIAYESQQPGGTSSSHFFIYRDGHFTRGLIPAPEQGDTLMVLSAILSRPFLRSKEALAHFPELAGVSDIEWAAVKTGPTIGDILHKSIFEVQLHFELHTQNVDILFGANGATKSFFVRDLFDAVDDPVVRLLQGKEIASLKEQNFFGYLNQIDPPFPPNASYWQGVSVHKWYAMWLPQVFDAANFVSSGATGTRFEAVVVARLVERFKGMLAKQEFPLERLAPYAGYATLFGPSASKVSVIDTIAILRDLWIKYHLDQLPIQVPRSESAAAIRTELLASKTIIAHSGFTGNLSGFRKILEDAVEPIPPPIRVVPEKIQLNENSPIFANHVDFWAPFGDLMEETARMAAAAQARRTQPPVPALTAAEEKRNRVEFGRIGGQPFARIKKPGENQTSAYFFGLQFD